MKKTFFLALASLLFLTVGCNSKQTTGNDNNNDAVTQSTESVEKREGLSIAYISTDSLMVKFDLAVELNTQMEAKMKKAESQISSKGRKLEKDIADYQEKASKGLLTRSQMAETEENLSAQQQQLMALRDRLTEEITEEQTVMSNRINHFVMEFINEYNADYKYDMILTTMAGMPVLHANPSLDITKEIIDGLNAKYIAERNAEKK